MQSADLNQPANGVTAATIMTKLNDIQYRLIKKSKLYAFEDRLNDRLNGIEDTTMTKLSGMKDTLDILMARPSV